MARTPNHTNAPEDFNKNFKWVNALDAYDYDDPKPLAELIMKETVPVDLRHAIADIVSGARKPNKRAASKLKIAAWDRMLIAESVSSFLGLCDISKYEAIDPIIPENKGFNLLADVHGIEPIEAKRYLEKVARDHISETAMEFGVSIETIENLLRDYRKKIQDYPHV